MRRLLLLALLVSSACYCDDINMKACRDMCTMGVKVYSTSVGCVCNQMADVCPPPIVPLPQKQTDEQVKQP